MELVMYYLEMKKKCQHIVAVVQLLFSFQRKCFDHNQHIVACDVVSRDGHLLKHIKLLVVMGSRQPILRL
jgi:hypothetical protein